MLSSSNFRIRASAELAEIRDEILDLATDRDVYWKVQREVIQRNARLLTARSPFFDMMNDSYAHATASRIRRLIDRDNRVISLRRLIEALRDYPDLLSAKMSTQELMEDLAKLDQTCEKVKGYVDQFVAHQDRSSSATVPTHRELNEAVDALIETFRKYYAVINGADIEVVVTYLEESLSIFCYPWIENGSQKNQLKPL
jgi:hypothetical protein